jgi:hypothetical protein
LAEGVDVSDLSDQAENIARTGETLRSEINMRELRCANQSLLAKRLDGDIHHIESRFAAYAGQGEKLDPQDFFDCCLDSLDKIEKERFILVNLLEGLKRDGKSRLGELLSRYVKVGVLDENEEVFEAAKSQPDEPQPGKFVLWALDALNRFWRVLVKAMIAALKTVLADVAKAVKPIIGTTGPLPTLTWMIDPDYAEFASVEVMLGAMLKSDRETATA